MKKIISTVIGALMLVFSLCFVGCGKTDEKTAETDTVLLNGFEDFDRDVQLIHLLNRFGTVDMNKDAKYVKSGAGSLVIRPLGYGLNNISPAILIRTYSTRFNFGFTDFNSVDAVSVSVYNAEEKTVKMGVNLAIDNGTMATFRLEAVGQTTPEWFDLKPGWNDVVMSLNAEYLKLQKDVSLDKIYGIVFKFESSNSFDIEDAPTLYLDDLYIHYGDTAAQPFVIKADAEKGYYELADFENPAQNCFFSVSAPVLEAPEIQIVCGAAEGVVPKSGAMLLKVAMKPSVGQGGYPYLYFADDVFKKVVKNAGRDLTEHPENYAVKFSVYNAADVAQTVAVDFSVATGESLRWAATNSTIIVPSGTWAEYEYTVANIDAAYQSSLKRATVRSIQATLTAEREAGKNVTLSEEEKTRFIAALGWTEDDLNEGLAAEYPKQGGVFTEEQTSDYIFKYYLYGLDFSAARALLLEKEVMLTSDLETMYNDRNYCVTENPKGMRFLLPKYSTTDSKNDRVLYFDDIRIEKIAEAAV